MDYMKVGAVMCLRQLRRYSEIISAANPFPVPRGTIEDERRTHLMHERPGFVEPPAPALWGGDVFDVYKRPVIREATGKHKTRKRDSAFVSGPDGVEHLDIYA